MTKVFENVANVNHAFINYTNKRNPNERCECVIMAKPKALFILHLPPPFHGAAAVGKYIHDSKIINEAFDADFIDLATNRILSQSGKGSFKKITTFAGIAKNVITVLRKSKYDLCYMTITAQGAGFYKDLVIVSILKIWRCNIVYHFHNKGVSNNKSAQARILYKYAFKNTKSILTSRYLYPDIQNYVKPENVFYCLLGIPVISKLSDPNKRIIKAESNARCRLLFLSNMIIQKGIFVLLEACEKIYNQGLSFECHYVGGWSDITEEQFKNEIDKRQLTNIVFAHGPKYNEEKQAFYETADVFVFPTHYDTFGLVNLEAMQNGLPVVSTPEGGIPDIVVQGETGFLVPHDSATLLAERLATLIKNPTLRYSMGEKGRQRFFELFTLETFENNLTQILLKNCHQN